MSLTLYLHPLASFCHKVLIALYENGTPFEARIVNLADPAESAELHANWPVGKIPVLLDRSRDRVVAETSIIIEYLAQHYPGAVPLVPSDPERALQARLWDRFFDLYVHVPMQKIVTDRLRPAGRNDPHGVEEARATLSTAYGMAERQLAERSWAIGDAFSIADCAATPALFYAHTLLPFGAEHAQLAAYFERLCARASVRRVIDEARPYFPNYPYYDAMPARFR
jgi:glutathione S-transferase